MMRCCKPVIAAPSYPLPMFPGVPSGLHPCHDLPKALPPGSVKPSEVDALVLAMVFALLARILSCSKAMALLAALASARHTSA